MLPNKRTNSKIPQIFIGAASKIAANLVGELVYTAVPCSTALPPPQRQWGGGSFPTNPPDCRDYLRARLKPESFSVPATQLTVIHRAVMMLADTIIMTPDYESGQDGHATMRSSYATRLLAAFSKTPEASDPSIFLFALNESSDVLARRLYEFLDKLLVEAFMDKVEEVLETQWPLMYHKLTMALHLFISARKEKIGATEEIPETHAFKSEVIKVITEALDCADENWYGNFKIHHHLVLGCGKPITLSDEELIRWLAELPSAMIKASKNTTPTQPHRKGK